MPNELIHETSPYLLQHAENPVDWRPWSAEALELARREDKPIFLSIGYAACHWCHVMAQESFEDPEIARILNENFVSIKVDREERPDLDGIYMDAVVSMTGQGGWPMSLFLTPGGQPFYGGTYFPPTRRQGLPSFREVLASIANVWQQDRSNVLDVARRISGRLQQSARWEAQSGEAVSQATIDQALERMLQTYDWRFGGWGQAPKFPQPMAIEFLLLQAGRGQERAQKAAVHALQAMQRGGIYDLLGGGFHRYATDNLWRTPHFEKMLSDNAQLALVYLHAFLLTGEPGFRQTCTATLDFIRRELSYPSGGFFSSLDADSEGVEGKYYLWTYAELEQALDNPEDLALAGQVYQVRFHGHFEGANVLQKPAGDEDLAAALNMSPGQLHARLQTIEQRLLAARSKRVRPAVDDKVLLSWNALALRAFAEAARYLGRPDYLEVARQNALFLTGVFRQGDRLLRSWRDGRARHNAHLEDYAAWITALLSLYQSDFDPRWYRQAVQLNQEMLDNFQDPAGGFFDTRADQAPLLFRPKEIQDNAAPSGNALAALALLLLASYSERRAWQEKAESMLSALQDAAVQHPTSFSYWLQAIDFAAGPVSQVALLWPEGDAHLQAFLAGLWRTFRPRLIAAGSNFPPPEASPALLNGRPLLDGKASAYVCYGFVCRKPVNTVEEMLEQLENPPPAHSAQA